MENKLACTTSCYLKYEFRRALEGFSKAGLKYIELCLFPRGSHPDITVLDKETAQRIKKQAGEFGMEFVSISGHTDLTKDEGVKVLKERAEFGALIGAKIINTGTGETETEQGVEKFFKNMKEIVKFVEPLGITVALETHGALTGTGKQSKETVERIGSKYIGINYDPANTIYYTGLRPEEDIKDVAESIVHLHIKDKRGGKGELEFPRVGTGTIDFTKIFSLLRASDYSGPMSFELEVKGLNDKDVDKMLKESADYVRGVFKKLRLD
jgi:sugar phosphate isomerase/epimerase